jgi:hypothetical protein
LFVRLITHQSAVLFSPNISAPAISHQPNEQCFFWKTKMHSYPYASCLWNLLTVVN